MVMSVRQSMQAAGLSVKGQTSLRKDLIRRVPIYASNPTISLRKQLVFVDGHFAIQGLLGAPRMGLWVDDSSVVTNAAKYQALLTFARNNGVSSLYLPLQPFKTVLDAAAIKDRLQSACDAPNFMSVELVYSDDGVYKGTTSLDDAPYGAVPWVTGTLDKCCKQGHANPVAVQSDVEPQAAGATSGSAPVNLWLTFLEHVKGPVHSYSIDLTVATAAAQTTWAGTITKLDNTKTVVPKASKWILDNCDRVVLMAYFESVATVVTKAKAWTADTGAPGKVLVGIWATSQKDPEITDIPPFLFKNKTEVSGWLKQIAASLAPVPSFGGVAVYRYESLSLMS